MNQPISWVKSILYDGLNKQPNLLGKINTECVLSYIYPATGLKRTQTSGFSSFLCCAKGNQHPIFGGAYLKKKSNDLFLFWMYTNKSKPFTIPIIFMTKRREKNQVIAPAPHALTFKHSTLTM